MCHGACGVVVSCLGRIGYGLLCVVFLTRALCEWVSVLLRLWPTKGALLT